MLYALTALSPTHFKTQANLLFGLKWTEHLRFDSEFSVDSKSPTFDEVPSLSTRPI
jgi:hypothetical protein